MKKEDLLKHLYLLSNEKYKEFTKKIIPGEFQMLGVRIPDLKKCVKKFNVVERQQVLNMYDENIYELRMIKALTISSIKDINEFRTRFEEFLPFINNWSICDTFLSSSKIIKKDKEYFWNKCKDLIKSEDEFLNRVAFVIILDYFIVDEYLDKIFPLIENYRSNKYYANMALAWLISFLYIKYPINTQTFLLKKTLDEEVLKMSIRKIKDSYRVSYENKEWLKKIG